jgi:beta-xylosidase
MAEATPYLTHINPVYEGYFADPFVWRHEDVYFAVGTGANEASHQPQERIFPVLRSNDFLHWQLVGNALSRPDLSLGTTFWAPAVAFCEGTFFLYYSVGHGDQGHQLRTAAAAAPEGPYLDVGHALLEPSSTPFAIDPHPFQDIDGQWYMFYACDFLDASPGARPGTALMVRQMNSMTELASNSHVVLRARSDWQRFEAARQMYGRVWDWHTLEGPCVVRHGSLYYCFYSGGRWENESYGVDYGVALSPVGPYSDAGNEAGPRVLSTKPGRCLGPGHNSHVIGPDGAEYLVYHAWNEEMTLRRICIDRLVWTPTGPRCPGQVEAV